MSPLAPLAMGPSVGHMGSSMHNTYAVKHSCTNDSQNEPARVQQYICMYGFGWVNDGSTGQWQCAVASHPGMSGSQDGPVDGQRQGDVGDGTGARLGGGESCGRGHGREKDTKELERQCSLPRPASGGRFPNFRRPASTVVGGLVEGHQRRCGTRLVRCDHTVVDHRDS